MAKPRPAPIRQGKGFRLHFSFKNKQYRRFLIKNQHVANVLQSRVNNLITEYKHGLIRPEEGQSLADFIFGKAVQKPEEDEPEPEITVTRLSQLIEEYVQVSAPPVKALSTFKNEQTHIRHLQSFTESRGYGDIFLGNINVGFFNQYKQFRYAKGIRTDTVTKELSTFQSIFQKAVEHGYLTHNMVREVKRDKSQIPSDRFRTTAEIAKLVLTGNYSDKEMKEIKRYRYLTPQEVNEVIDLADGNWLKPILTTFAFTGIRRGELLKLEWANVDLERRFIQVKSCKQSQSKKEANRNIYMHDSLLETLRKQKLKTGRKRWVFIAPNGGELRGDTISEKFARLVKGTKYEGIGFHVFRHSIASNLAASGVDQRIIDRVLGHQTETMRQRYQHLFPQQMKEALQKLGY